MIYSGGDGLRGGGWGLYLAALRMIADAGCEGLDATWVGCALVLLAARYAVGPCPRGRLAVRVAAVVWDAALLHWAPQAHRQIEAAACAAELARIAIGCGRGEPGEDGRGTR
ncbi:MULTISPECIES: hypothetical protein [Actinosynnema]|uniref:hypothetical protein n=1 Tax=Actinosynnema TaxID=40566 RepID=UPI0020A237D5|nr:hypothetical protein [Actinosynnema pretiosum]MCP2097365.1 hypothetical protein [Actinosynnema pretiosum]